NNSSIHTGSIIGHESQIGNSVFIAHGCNVSGLVHIEDGVFIGAGVTVVPRIKIGKWSFIGAGSVVTKNIPAYSFIFGNPGKYIKTIAKKYDSGNIL
ncbi:MAG: DapH/DapD/GlmU-related protein, partial [Thiotrichaceae bacterium]|nr:DapH/DapD/GlmU-related protein [Thiotrichaceae bacterium]